GGRRGRRRRARTRAARRPARRGELVPRLTFPSFEPARARRVFLSGLGLVYACAFASLSVQIVGLVGEHGILPIADLLARTRDFAEKTGMLPQAHHALPTLSWLDAGDGLLR